MTLTRNEIAAFVVAAVFLHLTVFYWAFWGRTASPGAMAPGSGGIMIDLAGQAGTGGAPKGNTSQPEPEPASGPVEKTAPPEAKTEPKPEPKPEPKLEPIAKSVPKPEPAPTPKPEPVPRQETRPEPQKRVEAKPAPPRENAARQGRPDGVVETSEDTAGGKPGLADQGEAGTGAATGGGTPGARADYRALLRGILKRNLRYPRTAEMRGIEGQGRIRLFIRPDGSLRAVEIISSTGSHLLDKEMEEVAERSAPFPPPPLDAGEDEYPFPIPVGFNLRSRW